MSKAAHGLGQASSGFSASQSRPSPKTAVSWLATSTSILSSSSSSLSCWYRTWSPRKVCRLGPLTISGAELLFPITYIFGDVFTEVYGYQASRRAIWIGFFASALLSTAGAMAVALPADPGWHNQQAFETVFGVVPRFVAASLIAYSDWRVRRIPLLSPNLKYSPTAAGCGRGLLYLPSSARPSIPFLSCSSRLQAQSPDPH